MAARNKRQNLHFHFKDWKWGAQWLSGRVFDSRPRGWGFRPHGRHCIVSLSKVRKTHLSLLGTVLTQEDPSQHNWKIVDSDVKYKRLEIRSLLSVNIWTGVLITSNNGVAITLKKIHTSKGDYWIKQWFSSIASLYKMGTSLKGKNLLQEGANSFLYE